MLRRALAGRGISGDVDAVVDVLDGPGRLHVVFDFDRTLTAAGSPQCHDALRRVENAALQRALAPYWDFRPGGPPVVAGKPPRAWWDGVHGLLAEHGVSLAALEAAAEPCAPRPGAVAALRELAAARHRRRRAGGRGAERPSIHRPRRRGRGSRWARGSAARARGGPWRRADPTRRPTRTFPRTRSTASSTRAAAACVRRSSGRASTRRARRVPHAGKKGRTVLFRLADAGAARRREADAKRKAPGAGPKGV